MVIERRLTDLTYYTLLYIVSFHLFGLVDVQEAVVPPVLQALSCFDHITVQGIPGRSKHLSCRTEDSFTLGTHCRARNSVVGKLTECRVSRFSPPSCNIHLFRLVRSNSPCFQILLEIIGLSREPGGGRTVYNNRSIGRAIYVRSVNQQAGLAGRQGRSSKSYVGQAGAGRI